MEKTKEARVSETVVILKKLLEVGIPATDAGYKLIKTHMSKWVHDGEALSTTVPLMRYGRDAHLELPATAGEVASCRLKVV
jgi:hypothetical protein